MDTKSENVSIYNRERFNMCGVTNIDVFDEEYVMLTVLRGGVCVEGNSLKIISLAKDSGEITITGNIRTVIFYNENEGKRKKGKGLFK